MAGEPDKLPGLFLLDSIAVVGYVGCMITTKDLAEKTGIPVRTLRWRAKQLGMHPYGHSFVLDDSQAKMVVEYRGRVNEDLREKD